MVEKHLNMFGGHVTEHHRHTAELAHEIIGAYAATLGAREAGLERESRATPALAQMGQMLWEVSYKLHPDDDQAAFENMLAEARWRDGLLAAALATPQQQIQFTWAARWADQGLPQVTMGHKYCAALLATTVDPSMLGDILPPWKAFLVVLPSDLLSIKDDAGRPVPLTKLLVQHMKGSDGNMYWNFLAMTDSTLTFWRHGCSSSVLVKTDIVGAWDGVSFMLPIDDEEDRVAALLGRLVINVCLAMSNPENVRAPKAKNKPRSSIKQRDGAPDIRTFQLGKPIELDCREVIREYVLHGSKKARGGPSVQVLVRGHWKRQFHGAGRVDRKMIWIEPYWRGPEDAPILARPIALKDAVP
jgi:hypothetical protein